MSEKIFIGKIQVKDTQYGEIIKVGFSEKDLETLAEHKNERGWVNISILNSKNGGKYGIIDTYQPAKPQAKPKTVGTEEYIDINDIELDKIPF